MVLETKHRGHRALYLEHLDLGLVRGHSLDRAQVSYTLTRARPQGWGGFDRRVDAAMLTAVGPAPSERPHIYVCGPTPFVEAVADLLVSLGHDPAAIRAERFGPTGG